MKVCLWLLSLLVLPITTLVITVFLSPMQFKIYDDPKARTTFAKRQLIEELKNPKLPAKRRQEVLNDIETIEAVEAELNDRRTLYTVIWENFSSLGRRSVKEEEYEKKLEAMLYTDIYTRANQIKTLPTKE